MLLWNTMEWWKNKNGILQIYPRSYKDSNSDGVGDIRGIIEKLPYLKGSESSLNIDAIWLSPFYPSPMADFGYDVSDYMGVDPLFGTLDDFKELLHEAHKRKIAVMIDLVPNHTSSAHPWFKEAALDPVSPKRDYYFFREAHDDSPPNNWLSVFGGTAWTKEPNGSQYYLHSFLDKQPDLNWANPEVQDEFRKIVRFWCDLGIDGFRIDAINWLGKHPELIDEPENLDYIPDGNDPYGRLHHIYSQSTAYMDTYLNVLTSEVKKYPGKIMLFESYADHGFPEEIQMRRLYDVDPSVSAPFHFGGIAAGKSARKLAATILEGEKARDPLSASIYCFGNHDKPRLLSRVGPVAARSIALIQLCLPGIPVIYYGEDIGMSNVLIDSEHVLDPFEKQVPGIGLGRDIARTPMQWNPDPGAGFTKADKPWLPYADDYREVNVMVQQRDKNSFFWLYTHLLKLRSQYKTLRVGNYEEIFVNDDVYIYSVSHDNETFLVVANLSDHERTFNLPEEGEVLLHAKHPDKQRQPTTGLHEIDAWDAVLIRYDYRFRSMFGLYNVSR